MTHLFMNSIYLATEGEGIWVGTPQVFIRFQGCAIGCLNCDSKDTWAFDDSSKAMTLSDVMKQIESASLGFNISRFSITGGDPLHPKHVDGVLALIQSLRSVSFSLGRPFFINIEAAGTRIVDEIFQKVDFISFDYKTPSTGVKTSLALLKRMALEYPHRFQVKAVIETPEDFKSALNAYLELKNDLKGVNFPWCLTPAYNNHEEFPMERFKQVLHWNHEVHGPFRVIGQQHKWIFGPDLKQV